MPLGEFPLGLVGRDSWPASACLPGQGLEEGHGIIRGGGDHDSLAVRPDDDFVPRRQMELVPEVLRDDDLPLRTDARAFLEHV